MNFEETSAFRKDVKKLGKKYKTLQDDIEEFKRIVSARPFGIGDYFVVLKRKRNVHIIKARFFCRALKGKHMRLVYAYHEHGDIALLQITFVELFHKGDKQREDGGRIEEYLNMV